MGNISDVLRSKTLSLPVSVGYRTFSLSFEYNSSILVN